MTDKQREDLARRCRAALRANPGCVWAKNELKYLDDDRALPPPIDEAEGAVAADANYHGGYTE